MRTFSDSNKKTRLACTTNSATTTKVNGAEVPATYTYKKLCLTRLKAFLVSIGLLPRSTKTAKTIRTLLASAGLSGGMSRNSNTSRAGITKLIRETFTKTASISEETLHRDQNSIYEKTDSFAFLIHSKKNNVLFPPLFALALFYIFTRTLACCNSFRII